MTILQTTARARELLADLSQREPGAAELLHTLDLHYAHATQVVSLVSVAIGLAALHGVTLERMAEVIATQAASEPDPAQALAKLRASEQVAAIAGESPAVALSKLLH